MKLSTMLRRELEKRGIDRIRLASEHFGVSYETTRRILTRNRIPKDRTLVKIARTLDLDPTLLIVAAHRQKLSRRMRVATLPVDPPVGGDWSRKRKWPLSQEQCDYLSREMPPQEIQFIRKSRQLTPEEKQHVLAYINYMFTINRVPPPQEFQQSSSSSLADVQAAS